MMSLLSELKCLRYEISSSGLTIWAPPNKTPVNQRGRTNSPHSLATCLPNQNDVFRITQRLGPIFFNSGQLIGSGDMCPQIKSIYFLVLLPKKWAKKA